MPSRRQFLKMTATAGATLALPFGASSVLAADGVRPFRVPLSVPPVMRPVRSDAKRDYYRLVMRRARADILPHKSTRIWGYDGIFPGPTFKVRRGRPALVRLVNRLGVPMTSHLHGGEVPWKSDGHPSLLIEPGTGYNFFYPNGQPGATLMYHDHTHHHASRNNYKGLSGLYIIEDENEKELNLPKGRYDIPLILHDRSFRSDGSLKFRDKIDQVLGDVYLVNGRPMPFLKVANRKYRFRIANPSNSRSYTLRLDSGDPLIQIGSDQGLLPAPYAASSILLSPFERVEVVVDFSRHPVGTRIVLQDAGEENARPIMQFRVNREEKDPSSVPSMLRPTERLLPGPDSVQREFVLSKDLDRNLWVINGNAFDPNRIDIKPRLGDTEVWTFRNQSSMPHPMHIHLVRFQILDRSNMRLTPGELGWKDTVRVDASATVSVIMRFDSFTGRYMYHCHNLPHEDHSMMGQMHVVPRR